MMNGRINLALFDVAMAARFVIGCGCLVAGSTCDSRAASVTVPLDFEVVETEDGAEVVAAFDLGVKFSEIESVTFSFVMEQGYEGSFVTTENSSFDRYLLLELRDESGLPSSGCSEICMSHIVWSVPAGEPLSYSFLPRFVLVLDPTDVEPPIEAGGMHTLPGAINLPDVLTFDPNAFYPEGLDPCRP